MTSKPNVGLQRQENGMIPCECEAKGASVGTVGVVNNVYVCTQSLDDACVGQRYTLVAEAVDLVANQKRMILMGLSGPDEGKWYTCTTSYFARAFKMVEAESSYSL